MLVGLATDEFEDSVRDINRTEWNFGMTGVRIVATVIYGTTDITMALDGPSAYIC